MLFAHETRTHLRSSFRSTTRDRRLINSIKQGQSGVPEVSSGLPSPPSSPPLAARLVANELALAPKYGSKRRDDGGPVRQGGRTATYTIREKCESLFCETLKNVFLGERVAFDDVSIGMVTELKLDAEMHSRENRQIAHNGAVGTVMIGAFFEVWDYVGGASFRGFVAGEGSERCLFTFFDSAVVGMDLKQGYDFLRSGINIDMILTCGQTHGTHRTSKCCLPMRTTRHLPRS